MSHSWPSSISVTNCASPAPNVASPEKGRPDTSTYVKISVAALATVSTAAEPAARSSAMRVSGLSLASAHTAITTEPISPAIAMLTMVRAVGIA